MVGSLINPPFLILHSIAKILAVDTYLKLVQRTMTAFWIKDLVGVYL